MLSFSEYPVVEDGVDSWLVFPQKNWLSNKKFIEMNEKEEIHPFSMTKNSRVFIGKSIPTISHWNQFGVMPVDACELIGSVFYSKENACWKLRVTYNGHTFDFIENFLVLSIPDSEAIFWKKYKRFDTNRSNYNDLITKYGMKASFNLSDCKYDFIGNKFQIDLILSLGRDLYPINPV